MPHLVWHEVAKCPLLAGPARILKLKASIPCLVSWLTLSRLKRNIALNMATNVEENFQPGWIEYVDTVTDNRTSLKLGQLNLAKPNKNIAKPSKNVAKNKGIYAKPKKTLIFP